MQPRFLLALDWVPADWLVLFLRILSPFLASSPSCSCATAAPVPVRRKAAKIARGPGGSSRRCPASEWPPQPVYGSCRPDSMPRPGTKLPSTARLACPSDAACHSGARLLLRSCSGSANCGGPAMTVVMGRRRCAHWMLLLFCCLLLTSPSHGTPCFFIQFNSVLFCLDHRIHTSSLLST